MAITKLMNVGESPSYMPAHLINLVEYVWDIKHLGRKTEFGKYVGGNTSIRSQEVIDAFLDTKAFFEKPDGRQGYHFVISFAPGECDADTCFEIAKEFCKKYLGDNYEYVYAVHTDKGHLHAHIVFNSVSRSTGLKYHYKKGDWKKYIQPITDQICKKNGLLPLIYQEERAGMNYAKWLYEKDKKNINWSHIIMADIDYAAEQADGIETFVRNMKALGYDMRFGTRLGNPDITFILHDADGKEHRRRCSALPPGYKYDDLLFKLSSGKIENPYYKELDSILNAKAGSILKEAVMLKNTSTYRRLYQAVSYYKLPNPYAVQSREVRTDMKRINKLIEECAYLKRNHNPEISLFEKEKSIEEKLHGLYVTRKNLYRIREQYKDTAIMEKLNRYQEIDARLHNAEEWGKEEEALQDEMELIEEEVPELFFNNEQSLQKCKYDIAVLQKEKRILQNILNTEKGGKSNVISKPKILP